MKKIFIILSILLILPSIIYLIQYKTILGFDTYYNFFINENINKTISTILYLVLFIVMTYVYLKIIKRKDMFNNIKDILKYVAIIGSIFLIMLPWTSSDIFYYMGVGELDSKYNQNPYYVTMEEYYNQNEQNIDDEILEKGASNFWAGTTVVYGPIAQLIFKICTSISMKNINLCLIIFKVLNLVIHMSNCYLIYKISGKKQFSIIYGLNPFILLECIGNVHNDIILVFFVLLALYFVTKKKNIYISILFLALATGIKYFTILLLPIIIMYYFRDEKRIGIRFLKCIQFGILFLVIFALEYILYFKDLQVILGMFTQMNRYAKSIYSVLLQKNEQTMIVIRTIIIYVFFIYYIKFCIDLITEKDIKLYKIMRKYNLSLVLAILVLTNCQQWYLVWLFATIMWQKSDMIKNIIGISAITEIANSTYMFIFESYTFDCYYVGTIIILSILWILFTNKQLKEKRIY